MGPAAVIGPDPGSIRTALNVGVIGGNPDVLRVGQVLALG